MNFPVTSHEMDTVYAAETGVLVGMLGGDVVEKTEAEVVGWFSWDEVKVDVFELSPR